MICAYLPPQQKILRSSDLKQNLASTQKSASRSLDTPAHGRLYPANTTVNSQLACVREATASVLSGIPAPPRATTRRQRATIACWTNSMVTPERKYRLTIGMMYSHFWCIRQRGCGEIGSSNICNRVTKRQVRVAKPVMMIIIADE